MGRVAEILAAKDKKIEDLTNRLAAIKPDRILDDADAAAVQAAIDEENLPPAETEESLTQKLKFSSDKLNEAVDEQKP